MKYSQFRIALLTFVFGFYSVPFLTPLYDKWCEPSVNLPKVDSEAPFIVTLCPETLTQEQADNFYQEHHFYYVPQSKTINCNRGGGGGSGGRKESVELMPVSKGKIRDKRKFKKLLPTS